MVSQPGSLPSLDPWDLIASDVLGEVALLADQRAVRELACVAQGAHFLADLPPGLRAQELVRTQMPCLSMCSSAGSGLSA